MDKDKVQRIDDVSEATGSTFGGAMRVIGTILLILVVAGLLFLCIFAAYVKNSIIPSSELKLDEVTLNQSSTILYEDYEGNWQELSTLSGSENRVWVDYDRIPKYMEQAVVAIEDKRFYKHNGVDWYRTAGAAVNLFVPFRSTFGGSTVTQQLIKNITKQDDITVQRKLLEIFQALELEKAYEKSEIMEYYLNVVYFGQGCYGIQTAAETYFGKDVSDLTLAEAASIAGITNLPGYYDPFVYPEHNKKRQEDILWAMYEQGYITKQEYKDAVSEDLNFVHSANEPYVQNIYSYYEEVVIDDVINDLVEQKGITEDAARLLVYNGGYQIYSCIDVAMQETVDSIYENYEKLPHATRNTGKDLQSGIVIMDQTTGEIKALSGGCGEKNINFGLNRATKTTRPTGSSIKGIGIYGPAVEYGLITPSTLVYDGNASQITLSHAPRGWYPKNDSGGNSGLMTINQALTSSVNTVSAQILDKLTPQASYDFLKNRLGIKSLIPDDCAFAPLALGQQTNGITVREMCAAYAALANDGVFIYPRTYTKVLDANGNVVLDNSPRTQNAFSAETAHIMTYMLHNAATYGTGSGSRLSNMPTAGKTGTSTNSEDRWFCGYTPYYTAAVWTGFDMPEYMPFSGNPAVTIWHDVMALIHAGYEPKDFVMDQGGAPTGIFGSRASLSKRDNDEDEDEKDKDKAKDKDKSKDKNKKNKNDKTSSTTEKPVVTEKVTEPETNETTENAA